MTLPTSTVESPSGLRISFRTVAGPAAVALSVAALLVVFDAHDAFEILLVLAVLVPVTVLVYGILLPRVGGRPAAGTAALILGLLGAALVVPAFWSGLPMVFGVGAVVAGRSVRRPCAGRAPAPVGRPPAWRSAC